MRKNGLDELGGQITRLENLKKDYELVKKDAEKDLKTIRQFKDNPDKKIAERAAQGEERAISVVAYYERKITQINKEIENFTRAKNEI